MALHRYVAILIMLCYLPLVQAGELEGELRQVVEIDVNNPATRPSKNILGSFGQKVKIRYAIGVFTDKKYNLKSLNFYAFPNNTTDQPVYIDFTVEYFSADGTSLGMSQYGLRKPIAPIDPNAPPSLVHGSSVAASDFAKIKTYIITFAESMQPIKSGKNS